MMLTAALTGGIATGKSVVAKALEELGCYIHHADEIAHELMSPGKPAWEKIVAHFGQRILNEDKTINRSRLGELIFADKKKRAFLNKLIHPLVLEEKKKAVTLLEKEGHYKIFISEAALTVEAGFAGFFDKVIIVFCKKQIQVKRLMERDKISRADALKKIKSQMEPKQKLKYADYVIETSGSIESTLEQTERVYRKLVQDYEVKCGKRRRTEEKTSGSKLG
jgi:dephospho-CoA kinase